MKYLTSLVWKGSITPWPSPPKKPPFLAISRKKQFNKISYLSPVDMQKSHSTHYCYATHATHATHAAHTAHTTHSAHSRYARGWLVVQHSPQGRPVVGLF
jgi:hypothetical protein